MLPEVNRNPKSLFNPLKDDFTVNYATDDAAPLPYTVPSLEIATFPAYIADHIAKKLAHEIVFTRGIHTNYTDDYTAVLAEIEVTFDD